MRGAHVVSPLLQKVRPNLYARSVRLIQIESAQGAKSSNTYSAVNVDAEVDLELTRCEACGDSEAVESPWGRLCPACEAQCRADDDRDAEWTPEMIERGAR